MDLAISEEVKRDPGAREEMKTRIVNSIEANQPIG
jgi:hypothetical protein